MVPAVTTIPTELQGRRDWRLELDGTMIESVGRLTLRSRFGELSYGLTARGHDGWVFHEHAGGGAVVVPFVELDGEPHIGVVEQVRHLQGGPVLNVPRGFVDAGELHAAAARRELSEETGLGLRDRTLVDLGGAPGNPNSAFFDTRTLGEGVRFFALALAPPELELHEGVRRLRQDLIADGPGDRQSRLAEAIGRSRFLPWFEAAQLGDLISVAAVARLLAWLRARGRSGDTGVRK